MRTTYRIERGALRLACQYFGHHLVYALIVVAFLVCGIANVATAADKRLLTVRDALQTTRFMVADSSGKSVAVSPDGRHYAAMLIRGDVSRKGVDVEIIAGGLGSLVDAKPYVAARFFTHALGATEFGAKDSAGLLTPATNFPKWTDNEHVAFLWEDNNGVHQVVSVNVLKSNWVFLTKSKTDVTWFAAGIGGTLIYEAKREYSLDKSNQLWHDGFTVTNLEAYSLLKGIVDGATFMDVSDGLGELFLQTGTVSGMHTRKVNVTDGGVDTYTLPWPMIQPAVSPDGRFASVSGTPRDVPPAWSQYQGMYLKAMLHGNRRAAVARELQQLFVVSVDSGSARPLWDAPLNPAVVTKARWAPDSRSILVWPVYLPVGSKNKAGLEGNAIAQIDVATGKCTILPISAGDANQIEDAQWRDPKTVEVDINSKHLLFRKQEGQWTLSEHVEERQSQPNLQVEVRQNPNSPPVLYAVDNRTGREQRVFDPNPQLQTRFSLGKVKFIHWRDKTGYRWKGRLFLPVGYNSNRRYPLVIQTHGEAGRQEFTLYGEGNPEVTLGPGPSVYLAQPLANRGIAVLQVGGPLPPHQKISDEAKLAMRGFISAIGYLSSAGIIDRDRVGIMGHSRAEWHVEFTLAFSGFPFAAAIVDDGIDSGYFEAGLMGWADVEDRNVTEPFGSGMKDWLERSPVFNAEHIRSPLLMAVTDSFAGKAAPVVMQWEMFSRLRHLHKPVELYVIPNIDRGSHELQNPTQLLALQERAMDWWLYWLKDERDPSESKRLQYAAWDRLRILRDEDAKRPAPPYLQWTAEQKRCRGDKHCRYAVTPPRLPRS